MRWCRKRGSWPVPANSRPRYSKSALLASFIPSDCCVSSRWTNSTASSSWPSRRMRASAPPSTFTKASPPSLKSASRLGEVSETRLVGRSYSRPLPPSPTATIGPRGSAPVPVGSFASPVPLQVTHAIHEPARVLSQFFCCARVLPRPLFELRMPVAPLLLADEVGVPPDFLRHLMMGVEEPIEAPDLPPSGGVVPILRRLRRGCRSAKQEAARRSQSDSSDNFALDIHCIRPPLRKLVFTRVRQSKSCADPTRRVSLMRLAWLPAA